MANTMKNQAKSHEEHQKVGPPTLKIFGLTQVAKALAPALPTGLPCSSKRSTPSAVGSVAARCLCACKAPASSIVPRQVIA